MAGSVGLPRWLAWTLIVFVCSGALVLWVKGNKPLPSSRPLTKPIFTPVKTGTFQKSLGWGDRYYVLHVPHSLNELGAAGKTKFPLVVIFHGMTRTAWYTALNETGWMEVADRHGFIALFAQSGGSHTQFGGETQWKYDVASDKSGAENDLTYVAHIVNSVYQQYPIDQARTYAIGLSNGGLFLSNVIIKYSELFASACNNIGGYVRGSNMDPRLAPRKVPLLIIVGDADPMYIYCKEAQQVFEKENGYHVEMIVLPGVGHEYRSEYEERIWAFFEAHPHEEWVKYNFA